ncbi:MAG: hypothetical protein QOE30_3932 [Mycobacterium sp.]|jgi:hypothetical protein|uniref:hypothetical protein n=1 Tax=Mycobacterium sp. TaxID=1785 RepID=UPI0028B8FBD2|nr:hypothetical protein [Mycobacterium sp.]MDT5118193.1 hypothetical protein [Mycobacterium sp.]
MTNTSEPHVQAAAGLFSAGTDLAFTTIGFLAAISLVIGTVSAIRTHAKEGAGSGITAQIGTIIFSVLVLLSVGIAAMVTHEFNDHGIRNTVHVDSPWGQ